MAQTKVSLIKDNVIVAGHLHTSHGITTDHIGEGSTRQYFTDARVQSYLSTNNYITTSDVSSLETTTSLSLNANVLSYVDESGTTTNIDLSLYLDDSNLARIVSGSLNSGTGVATFTRDDSTTFTVDFSAFLSDANDYVNAASFNTTSGVLTLTRLGGGTVTVDLDNRYLTSYTETDPVFSASAASGITSTNISNWNTAYGWGNHASAGYLTSYTETDPVFSASAASGITSTNISNWNTAYGWGNHASAGYLTSFDITTQTDSKYLRSDTNDSYSSSITASGSGWYLWQLGARGASSGSYGIGNRSNDSYRQLTFHVPNQAAYGSSGTIPSFGWYSNGGIQLMKLDSDSGNLWVKGQTGTNTPEGFRVDSSSYARIELDSNNSWSYVRLMDNGVTTWDIACYDSGNLEWRPGGGQTNRMTLDNGGRLRSNEFWAQTSTNSSRFTGAGDWGVRHYTNDGYIQFGPANTGHAHIYTDRSNFYFNKQLTVSGGSQINQSDIRSGIFYDVSDTSYFVNANGTGTSAKFAGNLDIYARSASWAEGLRVRVPTVGSWGGIRFTRDRANSDGNWALGYKGAGDTTDDLVFWANNSGTERVKMRISNDSKVQIGSDGESPNLALVYDDNHANGDRWDTVIQLGKHQERWSGDNQYPTYVSADGYGLSIQSNSDGVIYGMEQYSTGNFRPVIAWGDDSSDSPFIFRFNNNSQFEFGYTGVGYATSDWRAPIFYDSNNTGRYLNPASTSVLGGINMNGTLNMQNHAITGVDSLTFNDAGVNEGLYWNGGSGWRIFESPDNLTNAAGNLQFVTGSTRRMTLNTSGALTVDRIHVTEINNTDLWEGSITINGDAATYYPVGWYGGSQAEVCEIEIFRNYSETAPSSWNTSTHKGGLVCKIRANFGGWGGVSYDWVLEDFRETYSTMVAWAGHFANSRAFGLRLRGGGAIYHVRIKGRSVGPTITYGTWDPGNNSTGLGTSTSVDSTLLSRKNHVRGNYLYSYGEQVAHLGSTAQTKSGTLESTVDFRAPVFYDRNNTGYYMDPSSTSKIYNLELISAKHTYLYINPGNGYEAMVRFNGGSGSTWYVGSRTSTQLLGSTDAYHVYSQTTGQTVGGYDASGNHYAVGSSRSPIFYDSNNTGYYCDPASTSNFNTVYLNAQDWGGTITWNTGVNINVSGESSFDLLGSSAIWQVWTANNSQPSIYVTYAGQTEIGLAGNRGLKVHGNLTVNHTSTYGSANTITYSGGFSNGMIMTNNTGTSNRYGIVFYYGSAPSSPSGYIRINSTSVSYVTSSDYRLKENIVPVIGAIDRLSLLKPSRFNFIGEEDVVDGFLAHEVEDIVPEAISGTKDEVDEDGNPVYQGIDQSKLVPLLTAALQEAIAKIENLESRLQAIENQ
jgi:hypothetical protein